MAQRRLTGRAICGLMSILLLPCTSYAEQFDYVLGLGLEHNDNVNLSQTDPVTADILRPALGFRFSEAGSAIQANADGILEYRDYLNGPFSNELRSQLSGRVNWVVLPERLSFVVEDYLGVQPINTLVANAPSNVQQTNVFAVGPTLDFRLGAAARGQAEFRYINSYAEDTGAFDSQRLAAALRIIRDIDAISQVSGNLQIEQIDFTHSASGPNYNRYSLYCRYKRTLRQFDLGADLGLTQLDSAGTGGSDTKPLVRATADWRPSERSTVTLDAAHQYTDAASSMISTVELRIVPVTGAPIPTSIMTGGLVINSDPYLEDRVGVAYTWQEAAVAFGVAPFYRKLAYAHPELRPDNNDLNLRGAGANVFASWQLRPNWKLGVVANDENLRYRDIDRTDRNLGVGVFLTQQWTRHWSWRVDLSHARRNSSAPGQSDHQNVIYFGVAYTR